MEFNNQLPEWKNEGVEPSDSLKTNGFSVRFKPPADIFNWFWSKVIKAIKELQTILKKTTPVTATSTDGITYTATIEGITELFDGLEITILPNMSNTSNAMTLNVNGLGDKPIRRPLSFSTYVADSAKDGFLHKDAPCRLMYHATYPNRVNDVSGKGIWLMADKVKVSAQDLYGKVPIESGGTDATTAEEARANIGAAKIVHGSYVGTGKSGSANPNTISFDFEPKVVIVKPLTPKTTTSVVGGGNDGFIDQMIAVKGITSTITGHYINNSKMVKGSVTISWDENSLSWYGSSSDEQLNTNGETYYYIAIG